MTRFLLLISYNFEWIYGHIGMILSLIDMGLFVGEMDANRTPMATVSRPRTRCQWDEYYRNRHNELKRKDQESGGIGGRGKRVRNVVDSEYIVVNRDGGESGEKHDFVIIGEKRGGEENIEHAGSSGTRRGNAVQEFAGSRKVARKRVEEEKDNDVAFVGWVLRGNKKLDVKAENDGDADSKSDDDVEFLGEQVVSNGSSLKTCPESKSESGSTVGNSDEVVSCITKRFGNTTVGVASGGKSGQRGRGRPRNEPLDGKQMSHDVSVDLENFMDSGNPAKNSDGKDNSVDLSLSESESTSESESESTSEEDDEFSDEDYKVDQSSTSESDVSHYDSDVELEKDDEYDAGENENLMKGEDENLSNTVEDKITVNTHRESTGMNMEKESDTEQEKDDESDEGDNGDDHGSNNCNRRSNQQKSEDVVIILNDKEKFPSVRKSARNNQKGVGELDGVTTIYPPSSYSCMDKARKDGDTFGSLTDRNVSKEFKDTLDEIGLKKRNVSGLEVLVDSDKSNDKEEIILAKCLRSSTTSQFQKKEPELGKYSSPVPIESASSMDNECKSSRDEDSCHVERVVERAQQCSEQKVKLSKKKSRATRNLDLIKILIESINSLKEKQSTIEENGLTQELPFKFRFEDEVLPPHEKSEWEKHMDSLFCDLELGLRECEIDCTNSSVVHFPLSLCFLYFILSVDLADISTSVLD